MLPSLGCRRPNLARRWTFTSIPALDMTAEATLEVGVTDRICLSLVVFIQGTFVRSFHHCGVQRHTGCRQCPSILATDFHPVGFPPAATGFQEKDLRRRVAVWGPSLV